MLTRLKIHAYRNVRPGTEIVFNEHINILLGRNGTGKTTLLDLLSVVLRSDYSGLRNEDFDIEYDASNDVGSARVRVSHARVVEDLQRELPLDPGIAITPQRRSVPRVHAVLTLTREQAPRVFEIEIESASVRYRLDDLPWQGGVPVEIFGMGLVDTILRAAGPAFIGMAPALSLIPRAWSAYRFDESIETFRSIATGTASSGSLALPPHLSSETTFGPPATSESGVASTFVTGMWSPHTYKGTPAPGQMSVPVSPWPAASLTKFPSLAGLRDMTVSREVEGSRQEKGAVWWRLGRAEFFFTEPGGSTFTHNALSYGQKRLLAFLYYLDANQQYVIADELVNGMHHEWIRFCLDELGTRQSFLTSQNPLLLDYVPIGSAEQARKTFLSCRAEVADGRTEFVWSNLSSDDAEELFRDHQTGIQSLGEILRVRRLW